MLELLLLELQPHLELLELLLLEQLVLELLEPLLLALLEPLLLEPLLIEQQEHRGLHQRCLVQRQHPTTPGKHATWWPNAMQTLART